MECIALLLFELCALATHARHVQLPEVMDLFDGNTAHHQFIQAEFEKFRQQEMTRAGPAAAGGNVTSQVAFLLYTRSNLNASYNLLPEPASIAASPFDRSKPTRVMTHGFWSSGDSDTSQSVKDAYLTYQDVNVVLVDWNGPAATLNYISAAMNTVPIGAYTATLLDALVDYGASPKTFHLVGHSLGAHISGFAGKYTRQKVARITGLDPAGPLFETLPLVQDHLSPEKADFVDVIHTSAGALGFRAPLGCVDFYPNGGTAPQPGCESLTYVLGGFASMIDSCSHGRSWMYFADSINPRELYVAETEAQYYNTNLHEHYDVHEVMGEYVHLNGFGVYYLKTSSQPPYALN